MPSCPMPRAANLVTLVALLLVPSCGTPIGPSDRDMDAAKATADPTVTAADPSSAGRDTTLDVRVLGTGFDLGSRAEFARGGMTGPDIRTNRTTYVSSKEIVANITISPTAAIDRYDVVVTTSRGKKGIGTERFAVAPVQDLGTLGGGTSQAEDVDLNATVIGYSRDASGRTLPFVRAISGPMQVLPLLPGDIGGNAIAIVDNGVIYGESRSDDIRHVPVRWVPDGAGSWSVVPMALPAGGVTGHPMNADDVTQHVTGEFYLGSGGDVRAAYWDPEGNPVDLHAKSFFAANASYSIGRGVNGRGVVVGEAYGPALGYFAWVWERASDQVWALAKPSGCGVIAAWSINNNDEIAGYCNANRSGRLLLWRRQGTGGWGAAQELGRDGDFYVRDINDAGIIVGRRAFRPFAYIPGRGLEDLPAVAGNRTGGALRLNDGANPYVAGILSVGGGSHAIRWTLVP